MWFPCAGGGGGVSGVTVCDIRAAPVSLSVVFTCFQIYAAATQQFMFSPTNLPNSAPPPPPPFTQSQTTRKWCTVLQFVVTNRKLQTHTWLPSHNEAAPMRRASNSNILHCCYLLHKLKMETNRLARRREGGKRGGKGSKRKRGGGEEGATQSHPRPAIIHPPGPHAVGGVPNALPAPAPAPAPAPDDRSTALGERSAMWGEPTGAPALGSGVLPVLMNAVSTACASGGSSAHTAVTAGAELACRCFSAWWSMGSRPVGHMSSVATTVASTRSDCCVAGTGGASGEVREAQYP